MFDLSVQFMKFPTYQRVSDPSLIILTGTPNTASTDSNGVCDGFNIIDLQSWRAHTDPKS